MIARHHLGLLLFIGAAISIYGVALAIVHSGEFANHPSLLALGVTADMTLLVPLLYYLLVIRRTRLPWIAIVPVFILTLFAAALVLPDNHEGYLEIVGYLAVPAELAVAGYIVWKVGALRRSFKGAAAEDVLERMRYALDATFGPTRVAGVILSEMGFLYYALFSWRAAPPVESHAIFSYHRKSGYGGIVAALLIAMAVEGVAAHFLLGMWSGLAAWIATGLTLYSAIWLLGDYRAALLRPISVSDGDVRINAGLRWSTSFPAEAVSALRPGSAAPRDGKAPGYLNASLLGTPRLVLELKEPAVAVGIFGIRREFRRIGISVDDPRRFEKALTEGGMARRTG